LAENEMKMAKPHNSFDSLMLDKLPPFEWGGYETFKGVSQSTPGSGRYCIYPGGY